jgi:hypothetical protein
MHLIQDPQQTDCILSLIRLDIRKAFDIIQAIWAFGVMKLLIQGLQSYVLIGYATAEVNGKKSILITIAGHH